VSDAPAAAAAAPAPSGAAEPPLPEAAAVAAAEPAVPAATVEPAAPPCPAHPRDGGQKPDHVVGLLELSEAMTVVDLGSGSGYFLCWLSRAVGARGHVVATEVNRQLVRELKQRVARDKLANVDVVLAPPSDIGVAPASADRILLVNVWHHLSNRKRYARRVAGALAPGGKIVVVDFKPGAREGGHGIQPDRVIAELAAGGIDAEVVADELSDQFVVVGSVLAAR
jgi:predicted methyltransferase